MISPSRAPLVSGVPESTPAVASPRHTTRLQTRLQFVRVTPPTGRRPHRKLTARPNRNSCGTTRDGEVPTNTHGASKWRRSSERLIYDVHKINFGAVISHVRHAGSTGG